MAMEIMSFPSNSMVIFPCKPFTRWYSFEEMALDHPKNGDHQIARPVLRQKVMSIAGQTHGLLHPLSLVKG